MLGDVKEWLNSFPTEDLSDILSTIIDRFLKASKSDISSDLLLDFSFIEKKIEILGVNSLIIDYEILLNSELIDDSETMESLNNLLKAIQQSAHIIKKDNSQIASQLIGYLRKGSNQKLNEFIENIDNLKSKTWLRPATPTFGSKQDNLRKVFSGHKDNISLIKVIENGKKIISGAENGEVKIWDYESSNCIITFSSEVIGEIKNVIIAQDKYIIAISYKENTNTLTIWDKKNGTILKSISGNADKISSNMIIMPDEQNMITIDLSNTSSLVLWEIPTLIRVQKINHKKNIFSFSIYECQVKKYRRFRKKVKIKNKTLFEQKIRLITSSGGQRYNAKIKIKLFELHNKKFRFIKGIDSYLKGAKDFLVLKKSNNIAIWNWECIHIRNIKSKYFNRICVDIKTDSTVSKILPIKNNQELLIFSSGSEVWHYDIRTQECLNTFEGCINPEIEVLDGDEKALALSHDGIIQVWNLKEVGILNSYNMIIKKTIAKWISSDMFITSDYNNNIEFWEIDYTIKNWDHYNHNDGISSINVLGDGNILITASKDKDIKIFDIKEKKHIKTLSGHKSQVNCIDIYENHDIKLLISGSGFLKTEPVELKKWDLVTGECIDTLELFEYDIRRIEFIKDGQHALIFDGDLNIMLVDLIKKKVVHSYKYVPKFNYPKQKSTKLGFARYLDVEIEPWLYHSVIDNFLFATYADKTRLIVGYMDGALKVLDTRSGGVINNLEGHTKGINSLEVDFDGKFALTASEDTTIKLWNLGTGAYVHTYEYQEKNVKQAIFARWLIDDNRIFKKYILSISSGNTFKLWDFNSAKCINSVDVSVELKSIIAFKKSQRALIISLAGDLIILNVFSGEFITSLSLGRGIDKVVISKDEKTIIVGEKSGQLHFIDIVDDYSTELLKTNSIINIKRKLNE